MTPQSQPVFVRMTIRNLDDNEVFFTNENDSAQPLEITPGEGQIFPKVDEQLTTMAVGEQETLSLGKDEAFGDVVKEAIQNVPLENLAEELRKPGTQVSAQTQNNQPIQGHVVSIEEEHAVIDFNHPLAGKSIEVQFKVVEKP